MSAEKELLFILLLVFFVFGVAYLVIPKDSIWKKSNDDLCKEFYGQEYNYVGGGRRSHNLCVTASGEVRYFSIIFNR